MKCACLKSFTSVSTGVSFLVCCYSGITHRIWRWNVPECWLSFSDWNFIIKFKKTKVWGECSRDVLVILSLAELCLKRVPLLYVVHVRTRIIPLKLSVLIASFDALWMSSGHWSLVNLASNLDMVNKQHHKAGLYFFILPYLLPWSCSPTPSLLSLSLSLNLSLSFSLFVCLSVFLCLHLSLSDYLSLSLSYVQHGAH